MLDRVLKSSCPHDPATWHTAPTATGELLTSEDYRGLTPYEGNWWRAAALLVTGYSIPGIKCSPGRTCAADEKRQRALRFSR